MKYITRYDFDDLSRAALASGATQEDLARLGKWFERYGNRYWTGESYDVDGMHRLYPQYSDPTEDGDFDIVGWEMR